MDLPPWSNSSSQWFVLVTGSNSGLGFSICERTIDEFLTSPSRDPKSHLVLIVSTRSAQKTRHTVSRLRQHLRRLAEYSNAAAAQRKKAAQQGTTYKWQDVVARVHFLGVELDLCDLRQVYAEAKKIRGQNGGLNSPGLFVAEENLTKDGEGVAFGNIRIPRLDVLVLNAGIGGWTGIRWGPAVWSVLTDTKETVTWWNYNVSAIGKLVKPQGSSARKEGSTQHLVNEDEVKGGEEEPPLGEVFMANVFGHYVLAHELMPLLRSSPGDERAQGDKGRVIWLSTIEALGHDVDLDDIQGIRSKEPYRASKRLTDVLALTADLPGVRNSSASWFAGPKAPAVNEDTASEVKARPNVYLAHPGICGTDIMPIAKILIWGKLISFFLARWLGSVWHTITSYKGAVAPTWLALADQSLLDSYEGSGDNDPNDDRKDVGKGKWGSSTDFWGEERVRRTEVPGWGWCGKIEFESEGERRKRTGRKRDAMDLNGEEREEFEMMGRRLWGDMEMLRKGWERRLRVEDEAEK